MHPQSTTSGHCPTCGKKLVGYSRFCSRSCFLGHGEHRPAAERFWEKVHKTDGCWEWTASINQSGYGHFGLGRRIVVAHRVAYEWAYGPIPDGLLCCHRCDNRRCVRPDHLFLADNAGNKADARRKGRTRNGHTGPLPGSLKARGAAPLRPRPTPAQRFWSLVEQTAGCWLWIGLRNGAGYGRFWSNGRGVKAHRFAFELCVGPIAPGLDCCHRCDNPSCVRPDHLFLATRAANLADMWAKGRGFRPKTGPTVRAERRVRGEQHHKATITSAQVQDIRSRCAAGESVRALSRAFALSYHNIWQIVRRKTWTHLP